MRTYAELIDATVLDAENDCAHEHTEVRRGAHANGTVYYARQCLTCGERVGNFIKRDSIEGTPPPFDKAFQAQRKQALREARNARRQIRKNVYQSYLQSPEWARRRELVMRRADGICEGCGITRATEVHHLTYDHVFDELLWELVAVCRDCHAKAHGK